MDEKEETDCKTSKAVEKGRVVGVLQGVKEEEEGEEGEKEAGTWKRGREEEGKEGR